MKNYETKSEPLREYFFIQDKQVGSRTFDSTIDSYPSTLFLCTVCGKSYARRIVYSFDPKENKDKEQKPYKIAIFRKCPYHSSFVEALINDNGSILLPEDRIERLPKAVLDYELKGIILPKENEDANRNKNLIARHPG